VTGREELEQATGFGVETESGRIGSVAAVVPGAASTLLVHTGGRACTLTSVPFDDVAEVDIGARRVVLRGGAQRRRRARQGTPIAHRSRRVSGIT
jgi:hypothetical protein